MDYLEQRQFDLLFAQIKLDLYQLTTSQLIDLQIKLLDEQTDSIAWCAQNAAIADELKRRWSNELFDLGMAV